MNADDNPASTFFAGCEQGKFLLQRCAASGHLQYPPGPLCRQCGSTIAGWVEAGRGGTVESFSLVRRAPTAAFAALVPYMVGVVRLAEGPVFETWLKLDGRTPEIGEVAVGRAVAIEFQAIHGKTVPVAALR
jgi:uncharacterized OB-fold protein